MRRLIGKLLYKFGFYTLLPLIIEGSERSRVGIICKNEILLSKTMISEQKWNLLGGGKRASESIEDCAVREVKEESGIIIHKSSLSKHGDVEMEIKNRKYTLTLLSVNLKSKPEVKYPKSEILTMEWFDINQLPSNTHIVVKKLIKHLENS